MVDKKGKDLIFVYIKVLSFCRECNIWLQIYFCSIWTFSTMMFFVFGCRTIFGRQLMCCNFVYISRLKTVSTESILTENVGC